MSHLLRRLQGKSKSSQPSEFSDTKTPVVRIDTISLTLPEPSKISRDATVFLRCICHGSLVKTGESAFATNLVWNPAFEIPLADFTVEVILKPRARFVPDRKLETFSIAAAQITSSSREGVCKQTYHPSKTNKNGSPALTISFSGLPISSFDFLEAESSAMQSTSQPTPTVPESHTETAVNQAGRHAEYLQSPAGLKFASSVVDTTVELAGPVEWASAKAEPLNGTLECIAEATGYIDGIIALIKDFAEIHPISKVAFGALTKVYDLVKQQGKRDENIKLLASSMRDMLASLSEVRDLEKIKLLQSVICIAMTRVEQCTEFIDAYARHGFWGRMVRQSLSSRTSDMIEGFQKGFGELKEKFNTAISIGTIKMVAESHESIEILKKDLRNISDIVVAQVDDERLSKLTRSKTAAYDRGLRCHAGTRTDILKLIYDWIDDKEPGNNVFWLHGVAGTGKSTIASTVAAQLDDKNNGLGRLGLGSLGATFFCKRREDTRDNPYLVFPTLAFRLASTYPLLKTGIVSALKANPDIGDSSITNQFRELIVDPLSKLSNDLDVPPVVTVIDAADECGTESTREALLQCIQEACRLPVWFKLLITSRPEPDIVWALAGLKSKHEVNPSSDQTILDIQAYTEHCLAYLRNKKELDSGWPGNLKVNELVSRASGLFIWVTLSFEFMYHEPSANEALELVLKPTGPSHLDALYHTVLTNAVTRQDHFPLILDVLGYVVVSKVPLSLQCLCTLLELAKEKGKWARDRLASVLMMDPHSTIHAIHPSFLDFLTDHTRSKEFFIDVNAYNVSLARGCLRVMNAQLRTNICRLTEPTFNDQILDLASRLKEHVTEELSYSCRFWTEHLTQGADANAKPLLSEFFGKHMLHWLEVMSLRGEVTNAVRAIGRVRKWLAPEDPMTVFVQDVLRFCGSYGYVVANCAPHIYTTSSIFTPPESCLAVASMPEFSTPPKLENPPKTFWDPSLLTLHGHRKIVLAVAVSHEGTKIVSGSVDETLRVWDAESGSNILGPLVGHTEWVMSVAFSPDGRKIVSGSRDETLRVWDAESGSNVLGPLMGHTDSVTSVAFSPDGTKIVSGSDDETLRVWDAESGSSILGPLVGHTISVTSVAFSPDGTKIVSGSDDRTLRGWDAVSGSSIFGPLVGHTDSVTSVAFSLDGTKIVSGSSDKTLRMWDAVSGSSILGSLVGHTGSVTSVAFSPDGTKIVSGSHDKMVRVWDAESGSRIFGPLVGHADSVWSVVFSPDGTKIVSGSGDKTLRVWDAESGSSTLGPFVGHTDRVMSVAFSPDNTKIVSASFDSTLRMWDAVSGSSILGSLVGHTDSVVSVAFSPDGTKIVSGSYDETLYLWDAVSGSSVLGPLVGHTEWVMSVAFSPDGCKIVSGSRDKTLRVWDAESGSSILGPLVGHTEWVMSVAFSPDGTKIVSGSRDRTLRGWDAVSGLSIFGPWLGHTEWVMSVAFSPDGTKIVSGSDDKTLRVWDAESGSSILGPLVGHTDSVTSVAFSPDGTKIVSGSRDRMLRGWDAVSGSRIFGPLVGHTDWVASVAFSLDGTKIVSGSYDKTLRMWDAVSGSSILGSSVGHTDWVWSVAFSPDGTKIVSGSYDKTLHVWDAVSGSSILGPLVGHTDFVLSVAFSPDGTKIVSGSSDRTLRVWDAESGSSILGPLVGHTNWVGSVAFSPVGTKIVSSGDKTLRVWDAISGLCILGPLVGHADWVTSVAFSPDGTKIVSGSDDKTLRVWDSESGSSILGPLEGHPASVTSVAFSPDGNYILSRSHDGPLHAWHAQSGARIPISSLSHIHPIDPHPSSFSTTILADGWVVGPSDVLPTLWIPAHLRSHPATAVSGTRCVWFDSNNLPMIASGLDFSWWSRAGARP